MKEVAQQGMKLTGQGMEAALDAEKGMEGMDEM
jgi:hypothetical protein